MLHLAKQRKVGRPLFLFLCLSRLPSQAKQQAVANSPGPVAGGELYCFLYHGMGAKVPLIYCRGHHAGKQDNSRAWLQEAECFRTESHLVGILMLYLLPGLGAWCIPPTVWMDKPPFYQITRNVPGRYTRQQWSSWTVPSLNALTGLRSVGATECVPGSCILGLACKGIQHHSGAYNTWVKKPMAVACQSQDSQL